MAHWESGVRNPGVRSLSALCGPLKVRLDWLVSGEGDRDRDDSGAKPMVPLVPNPTPSGSSSFNQTLLRAATEVVVEIFKRRRLKLDPIALGKAITLVYEMGVLKGLDRPKATIQALKRSLAEDADQCLRGA